MNTADASLRPRIVHVASNGLQVVLDEVRATAGQWQGLSARFAEAVPPAPGQPFQPTTAAVNGVNAAIGIDTAAFASRIQSTAAGMTSATTAYTNQEATGAGEMTAIAPVTVV